MMTVTYCAVLFGHSSAGNSFSEIQHIEEVMFRSKMSFKHQSDSLKMDITILDHESLKVNKSIENASFSVKLNSKIQLHSPMKHLA